MHMAKFLWYWVCSSQVLNVFAPAETVIFRLYSSGFLTRNSQNPVNFVLNFDQWWHTRWCIRYATAFNEVLRSGQNYAKKLIFWLILREFLFTLSCTQWVTSRFWQLKDLIRIHICGKSFISIAQVVVKFKIFKVIRIHSASWSGLGAITPG